MNALPDLLRGPSTPSRPARILIVAGEASGDLHAGRLMEAMRAGAAMTTSGPGGTQPAGAASAAVEFVGIGGPRMRAAGLRPLADAEALGVTGVLEVLGSLGRIWAAYRAVTAPLADPDGRPDLVILVDYPDFNLRVAGRAHRAGVPVLYYISPQVWAWRRGRVKRIARIVDRMLVILPFEEAIYREAGLAVQFVGHPLLDIVRAERTRDQTLRPIGVDPRRPVIALLPGSRRNEIQAHLPPMIGAFGILRGEFRDLQAVLPLAPTLDRKEMEDHVRALAPAAADRPLVTTEDRYDLVGAADAAVVASGTATLETALLGVPMVIVYRVNALTYLLARLLSSVPHIGMPNLIAGERVVPELVQGDCRPETIAAALRRILTDPPAAAATRRTLLAVRSRLGSPGAAARAAAAAWDMIAARRGRT
jgi:lipid-A-disaccharide synthase